MEKTVEAQELLNILFKKTKKYSLYFIKALT